VVLCEIKNLIEKIVSYELSKSDKKAARKVIDLGMARELDLGVKEFDALIAKLKEGSATTSDTYWAISEAYRKHNKKIRQRYGDIRGSTYILTITGLLADKVIHEIDLNEFSPQTREYLIGVYQDLCK
jgi:hypothetical protein